MPDKASTEIFKKGSKTYFYSSVFFPREIKEDVFKLYAFVRTADDLVDSVPQDAAAFSAFRERYREALSCGSSPDAVIQGFVELSNRKKLDRAWAEAFLRSMEMDLTKKKYEDMAELDTYIYGSAEVIGLMMARVMDLPKEAEIPAKDLGKAMQLINFIRDINEDLSLGRTYIPATELRKNGLKGLDRSETILNKEAFCSLIRSMIEMYTAVDLKAREGFCHIPGRYLVPVATAADMYRWTSREIYKDPFVVYNRQVKPSKGRILLAGLKNFPLIMKK